MLKEVKGKISMLSNSMKMVEEMIATEEKGDGDASDLDLPRGGNSGAKKGKKKKA